MKISVFGDLRPVKFQVILLRGMNTLGRCFTILSKGSNRYHIKRTLSMGGTTLKRMNLLLRRIFFPFKVDPINTEGEQKVLKEFAPFESYPFPLIWTFVLWMAVSTNVSNERMCVCSTVTARGEIGSQLLCGCDLVALLMISMPIWALAGRIYLKTDFLNTQLKWHMYYCSSWLSMMPCCAAQLENQLANVPSLKFDFLCHPLLKI